MFYWDKIQSSDNLSFLVKTKNVQTNPRKRCLYKRIVLSETWRKILEQYIAKFGFSETIKEIDFLERNLGKLKIEKIVNDDSTLNALIEIEQEKIDAIKKECENIKSDFWKLKGSLDRHGFNIDPMKTSVEEFYTHYFSIIEENGRRTNK
jgi:hypothetical protein